MWSCNFTLKKKISIIQKWSDHSKMKRKIQNYDKTGGEKFKIMIKREKMKNSIENEEGRVEWSINFTGLT